MKNYVAYYRVSTKQQEITHLGLDAQKNIVKGFVENYQGNLLAEYEEVESGKKNNRPILEKAIAHCVSIKAILIIAKLDRLARNVKFIFTLRDSGVNFVACDIPDFNTLTLGVFASFAQYEAERISQRTKDALKVAKARGKKLGSPVPMKEIVKQKGRESFKEKNKSKLSDAFKQVLDLRNDGKTYREIADRLNKYGFKTIRNSIFTPTSIRNMFTLFQVQYIRLKNKKISTSISPKSGKHSEKKKKFTFSIKQKTKKEKKMVKR